MNKQVHADSGVLFSSKKPQKGTKEPYMAITK